MCGITGFVPRGRSDESPQSLVLKMSDALVHRGPDDRGAWVESSNRVALGFRRLAIIDLSQHGHQPMRSACGRYTVVYNGEIYNHLELRSEIEATGKFSFPFRGHSDTEVLLAAITCWGFEAALKKLNGMFAIGLWDNDQKALFLARDRVGIKPLYYGTQQGTFLFGSEIKALAEHPDFEAEIDTNALTLFLRHAYIPTPYCIFKGIQKLPPGHYLRFHEGKASLPKPFWSALDVAQTEKRHPLDYTAAVDELQTLLSDSIEKRMMADVPLGAFLSGGVDSSTIVALMQNQSSRPIQTFSIGFSGWRYNEAIYAKKVAQHLGTDHTELYVSPQCAMDVVPLLPQIYDEPFADSSQIPTYLVSKLAKQKVTVSLSGDGGDELFGGYDRYRYVANTQRSLSKVPKPLKPLLSQMMGSINGDRFNDQYFKIKNWLPKRLRMNNPGNKLSRLGHLINTGDPGDLYRDFVSHWKTPSSLVPDSFEPPTVFNQFLDFDSIEEQMMYIDLVSYLPDDILAKVDRASMAVSLEARVPILDYRVVEFAWQLPLSFKTQNGVSKRILRDVLYRFVPREMIERPKIGFGIPIDEWLRGPLKDWAGEYMNEERLQEYFTPAPILKAWKRHQEGNQDYQHHLWAVLMFLTWHENFKKNLGFRKRPSAESYPAASTNLGERERPNCNQDTV